MTSVSNKNNFKKNVKTLFCKPDIHKKELIRLERNDTKIRI